MGMRQRSHDYVHALEKTVSLLSENIVALMEKMDPEALTVKMISKDVVNLLSFLEKLNNNEEQWMYAETKKKLSVYIKKD